VGVRGPRARPSPVPVPDPGHRSDNGGEYINTHLLRYPEHHQITFTRSRPDTKNDGCHVEENNCARARELVGYYRYDTPCQAGQAQPDLGTRPLFGNHFLPQQTLILKRRVAAKVIKRQHPARTPAPPSRCPPRRMQTPGDHMNTTFKRLKPAPMSRQTLALTGELETIAVAKTPTKPKPAVNHAWNNPASGGPH
jgi:hypothetical protein